MHIKGFGGGSSILCGYRAFKCLVEVQMLAQIVEKEGEMWRYISGYLCGNTFMAGVAGFRPCNMCKYYFTKEELSEIKRLCVNI